MSEVVKHATGAVLRPASYGELERFAVMAAKSSMVPKDFVGRPENVMLAVQMGSEIGLSPMQALQNIAVISGRPSLWGDAMLGVCRGSPVFEDIVETIEGEGDAMVATCTVKRKGSSPVTARFSVLDAKKAELWSKPGPWKQYPSRMLKMRARAFALRDAFPDVLRGLASAEEVSDIPADTFRGVTVDAEPRPAEADKVQAGVDALVARFDAVNTLAEFQAICSDTVVNKQIAFLVAKHPEHAKRVEEAMNTAGGIVANLGEPIEGEVA
jgi:hypothetical protein